MIEIAGIPYHKEENCIQLISKLGELVEITNFNKNQIDLAHRTSTKTTAPIIILFNKKSDRIIFYNQRKRIKKLRSGHFQIGTETGSNDEERGIYIYMNKSLTPTNRKLLKEARQHAKGKDYSFKGYTINGQVRVRKSTTSEPIIIESLEDIGKIVLIDCLKMFEKIPRIFKIQVF